MAQPITNHCTMWSGTYYIFASDEPCAHFLVYHSYITCLYVPYHPRRRRLPEIQVSPNFRLSTFALPHICLAPFCIALHHLASHCPYLLCHAQRQSLALRSHPQSHIEFMLILPALLILAVSLAYQCSSGSKDTVGARETRWQMH